MTTIKISDLVKRGNPMWVGEASECWANAFDYEGITYYSSTFFGSRLREYMSADGKNVIRVYDDTNIK